MVRFAIKHTGVSMLDDSAAAKIQQLESDLAHSRRHTALIMQIAQSSMEPGGVGELVRRCLELVTVANNWVFSQFWIVREKEESAQCSPWYFGTAHLPEFRAASVDRKLSKGVGLPGRVWSTGCPLVLSDLESVGGLEFPRKAVSLNCGLRSAFAFPVKNGPFVTGVAEFFDVNPIKEVQSDTLFYEKLGIYIATLIGRKETEHAAQQQDEVNQIILNHAYNAFICINEASIIIQWTSKATALFGWEADEVIGKPLSDVIIPQRYRDAHIKGLFRYMTSGEQKILDKPVRAPALHKRGHEIPIELFIFPIQTASIKRFGAFVIDRSRPDPASTLTLE